MLMGPSCDGTFFVKESKQKKGNTAKWMKHKNEGEMMMKHGKGGRNGRNGIDRLDLLRTELKVGMDLATEQKKRMENDGMAKCGEKMGNVSKK